MFKFEDDIELVLIDEPKKKSKVKKNKKKQKTKKKSKKKKKGLVITCIILDVLALLGYFVTYGPWSYPRELLITTAMTTMHHKYLARIFYSEDTIKEVLSNNMVEESGESTDSSLIDFVQNDSGIYESIYEEQILKRDKDEPYKLIPISGDNYKGTLVAIYDASKVELAAAKYLGQGGEYVSKMADRMGGILAINAGGFDSKSRPTGTMIKDGKVVYRGNKINKGGGLIGFTKDNVLMLSKEGASKAIAAGMEDAVEFGPFLIVNGEASFIKGNGGWGIAPRTAIGQRKDGIVLFLVIDGRQSGYSIGVGMSELTKILQNYGAYNAANLDGGGSSILIVDGKVYNKPWLGVERYPANAWVLKGD